MSAFGDGLHRVSFGLKTRTELYQLLADFTGSGLELGVSLETGAAIYRDRGNRSVAHILMEMRRSLAIGAGVQPVLGRFAPESERLIFLGEGSIEAATMFGSAARISRSQLTMQRAMIAAVAGPMLAIVSLIGLYYLLGSRMFPAFELMAPRANWPVYAQVIAAAAGLVADYIIIIVPALALAIAGIAASTRHWTGFGRSIADRVPPWSLYRMQTGLLFLMLLVESGKMGRNLNTAFLLDLARQSGPYLTSRIRAIARLSGNDPSGIGAAAVRSGHGWPGIALSTTLAAYSRQDNWLQNYSRYLDRYLETVEITAKAAASTMNYILLALVAGSLAGALLTVFSLIGQVQNTGF